jgi:hypothetical protein
MRRITLVLALAVVMATMVALTVGSALAKDSNSAQTTYTDSIVSGPDSYEYNAVPPHLSATGEGIGQFRATVAGDLPGKLDATIYYTGIPGPNVTSEITHGTWILCSEFTADPSTVTEPECTSDSAIQLTGTVRGGTARWDEVGNYVPGPLGTQVWIGIADVKATLGITGGTVDGVSVEKGSGKFEGELDHFPLITGGDPTVTGDVTLKF